MPLLFKVMDYKTNSGNHKMVGAMIATYSELKSRLNSGNIVLQKKDRTDQRGWLEVAGVAEGRKFQGVLGDRVWEGPLFGRLRLSDPAPFEQMPIVYERAFGGSRGRGAFFPNPIGVGN